MAYFDSTKNRALWEIELQSLRKRKADRAAGRDLPKTAEAKESAKRTGFEPVRTSYKELLKEEAAGTRKMPSREHRKAMEAVKAPEKRGPGL